MTRLIHLAAALLLATAALAVHAQPAGKVARLGVLLYGTAATDPNLASFVAGLRELGYVEGRNLALETRGAEGHPERIPGLVGEAVASKPDVLVVLGGDLVRFVGKATSTIPVVMLTSYDPVEAGMIKSYARPGGNMTGVAYAGAETGAKRLQFLKEAAPAVTRVAVLWDPDHADGEFRDMSAVASRLGIQLQSVEVRRPEDFPVAFESAAKGRAEALVVVSSRLMNINQRRILEFASRQRILLVSGWGPWVRSGGFMSYGPDLNVLARRAATHVDKILKGARPGELPVEQPTQFELVINVKTATALGITVPPSLLARADHVVQ